MVTEADKIAIDSMRNIISGLRGANETAAKGDQQRFGIEAAMQQRQQQQQFTTDRDDQSREFARQQAFEASARREVEAQKGRDFTTGRDIERFKHEENMLEKKPQTSFDKSVEKEQKEIIIEKRKSERTKNFADAGGLDSAGLPSSDEVTRSDFQGKYLRSQLIEFSNMSDEEFESSKEGENASATFIKTMLEKAKLPSSFGSVLQVQENETREQYVKRLSGFRASLIDRETKSRIKKIRSQRTTGGRGPVRRRTDEDIGAEVTKEFGGSL